MVISPSSVDGVQTASHASSALENTLDCSEYGIQRNNEAGIVGPSSSCCSPNALPVAGIININSTNHEAESVQGIDDDPSGTIEMMLDSSTTGRNGSDDDNKESLGRLKRRKRSPVRSVMSSSSSAQVGTSTELPSSTRTTTSTTIPIRTEFSLLPSRGARFRWRVEQLKSSSQGCRPISPTNADTVTVTATVLPTLLTKDDDDKDGMENHHEEQETISTCDGILQPPTIPSQDQQLKSSSSMNGSTSYDGGLSTVDNFHDRSFDQLGRNTIQRQPDSDNDPCCNGPVSVISVSRNTSFGRKYCRRLKGGAHDQHQNSNNNHRASTTPFLLSVGVGLEREEGQSEWDHIVDDSINRMDVSDISRNNNNNNHPASVVIIDDVDSDLDTIQESSMGVTTSSDVDPTPSITLLDQDNQHRSNNDDNDDDGRTTTRTVPSIPAIILMEYIASYIGDRTTWNAIATLNRELYSLSQTLTHLYRPWPQVRWRVASGRAWSVSFGTDYLCCGTDQGTLLVWSVHGRGVAKCLYHNSNSNNNNNVPTTSTNSRLGNTTGGHQQQLQQQQQRHQYHQQPESSSTSSSTTSGGSGRINSIKCYGDWVVSGGDNRLAKLWNVRTWSCEAVLDGHTSSITSVSILPKYDDERSNNNNNNNHDDDGHRSRRHHHHTSHPNVVVADTMWIATGSLDGNIRLYSVSYVGDHVVSGAVTCMRTFIASPRRRPVYSVVMYESKDGKSYMISGGLDEQLRLWDISCTHQGGGYNSNPQNMLDQQQQQGQQNHHPNDDGSSIITPERSKCIFTSEGEIRSITISHDQQRIAASFGRTVFHCNLLNGRSRKYNSNHNHRRHHNQGERGEHHDQVLMVAQSDDNEGADLFGGGRAAEMGGAAGWNALKGHSSNIRCIDFSPDGRLIASACSDGTIRLWTVGEGTWKRKWKAHNGFMVSNLAFSPDGQCLLSVGSDGTIAVEKL